jgi:hypothetical protein
VSINLQVKDAYLKRNTNKSRRDFESRRANEKYIDFDLVSIFILICISSNRINNQSRRLGNYSVSYYLLYSLIVVILLKCNNSNNT